MIVLENGNIIGDNMWLVLGLSIRGRESQSWRLIDFVIQVVESGSRKGGSCHVHQQSLQEWNHHQG